MEAERLSREANMLAGRIEAAAVGAIGFDTADPLNVITAKQFANKGYKFCIRYVGRDGKSPAKSDYVDLSSTEADAILSAGLCLSVVQHPLRAGWVPSERLGREFGSAAAILSGEAGLPRGTTVWLDLEGVKSETADTEVIAYCNAWFGELSAVGYDPGVYIGSNPGLTAEQIYWDLKTTHYWKGGSSAKAGVPDEIPHRGYQLVQRIHHPGTPKEFDSDVVRNDAFGHAFNWVAPEWDMSSRSLAA
jgi:hypothetical protein